MGWIGVDLDATLAHYTGWKGAEHIGAPIEPMMARVRNWMIERKEVRIFTARHLPGEVLHVRRWLNDHGLDKVPVTNVKDMHCEAIWDDRAVRVLPNTGEPCCTAELRLENEMLKT